MLDQQELIDYLGADATAGLAQWERATGRRSWPPAVHWRIEGGYSPAMLAPLVVDDFGATWQLVLKVCPADTREPASHRSARREASAFAAEHLVDQPFDPWPTPSGGLLMFQALAGDRPDCLPLAALPRAQIGEVCGLIAGSLLAEWNEATFHSRRMRLWRAINREVGPAVATNGSVRRWASTTTGLDDRTHWIVTPEDPVPRPNPVAMTRVGSPLADHAVNALLGRSHLDLHLQNVLIPLDGRGEPAPDRFQLIDLATYDSYGSLTADPVTLMLSAVASRLLEVSGDDRVALQEAIVRTETADGVPPFDVVAAVYTAGLGAVSAAGRGWSAAWQLQFLVSVLARALLFTTFERLDPQVRWWFFRLAARAGSELLDRCGIVVPVADVRLVENPFRRQDFTADAETTTDSAHSTELPPAQPDVDLRDLVSSAWRLEEIGQEREAVMYLTEACRHISPVSAADPSLAVVQMRDLVEDAGQILGSEHPMVLNLRHELARLTDDAGDPAAARRLFDDVWRQRRRVLGGNHPDTMRSRRARDDAALIRRLS